MTTVSTFICLLVILSTETAYIEATLMLSPSGATLVCPGGELTLLCSTNWKYIEWNITIRQSVGSTSVSRIRLLSSSSLNVPPLMISTKSFIFTVNSTNDLMSSLTVANITAELNGTLVRCTDIGDSRADSSTLVATVHIINVTAHPDPAPPNVTRKDVLGKDDVTVILKWSQEMSGLIYNITILPSAPIRLRSSTSTEVTVAYNTLYNVSILSSFCGEQGTAMFFNLNFVKCGDLQLMYDSINVTGYSVPTVVGSNASFSCPPGLELIGPNSSTCMENGEWEPDPIDAECSANCGPPSSPLNGYILPNTNTLEGAAVMIMCFSGIDGVQGNQTVFCTRRGTWEPNPYELCGISPGLLSVGSTNVITIISSAASFALLFLTSIAVIIVGVVCCWRKRKQKHVAANEATYSQAPPTNVIYEEIMPRNQIEQDLELQQNVAYGPVLRPNFGGIKI